jgi:hypothetical protein
VSACPRPGSKGTSMRDQSHRLVMFLLLIFAGGLTYGQDPTGPQPKRARTAEDYKPRTLKELAAAAADAESRGDKQERMIVHGDVLPSRMRVTYQNAMRPLPAMKKETLRQWARLYAGSMEHYTVPYESEMLFVEDGVEHWLAVKKQSVEEFEKEFKKDDAVDLYLIRLGAVKTDDGWEPLLLIESFQKPK